jgi:BirA family transcriptional regulator, biotin operon repressor / biotin---[acetyl-CoA-carboxylase] ligase
MVGRCDRRHAAVTPQVRQFDSLPSTMDEARTLAEGGAPEGTIVQAGEQTAGRGRFGNAWTSPKGNLYMTIILRPKKQTRDIAQMSFAVALALADTIVADDVELKWPNDVLVGGKKIAGILLEMSSNGETPDYLLVGTGINIASGPEGAAILGAQKSVDSVRDEFISNLDHWYERWLESGFADIRSAWLARAHGIDDPITVRFADRSLHGIFEGIDEAGNLLLRQNDGHSRAISSGAVHFGAKPA